MNSRSTLSQWRKRRAAEQHVEKALRHAGRLSSAEILDTVDQAVFSIGQTISVLRSTTDPEYRFQVIAEAKANADIASVLLEQILERTELSIARVKRG